MKQYSITLEEGLVKEIDKLIKELGTYSSRNDFIRDSIRKSIEKLEHNYLLKKEIELAHKKGHFLTEKEKDEVWRNFLKKKGFNE